MKVRLQKVNNKWSLGGYGVSEVAAIWMWRFLTYKYTAHSVFHCRAIESALRRRDLARHRVGRLRKSLPPTMSSPPSVISSLPEKKNRDLTLPPSTEVVSWVFEWVKSGGKGKEKMTWGNKKVLFSKWNTICLINALGWPFTFNECCP